MAFECLQERTDYKPVEIGGHQLQYNQVGTGDMIVLIPPPLADHRIFCTLQEALADKYRTVAVDLPQADDLDRVVSLLKQLIDVGTTQPFYLLGLSASGWIAQFIAQHYPEQLKGLILINSIYSNDRYTTKHRMAVKSSKFIPSYKFKKEAIQNSKRLLKGLDQTSKLEQYFKYRIDELGKSEIRNQLYWIVNDHSPPPTVNKEVLIIQSTLDTVFSEAEHKELVSRYPNATAVAIKTNAHLLHLSHRHKIRDLITNFIAK